MAANALLDRGSGKAHVNAEVAVNTDNRGLSPSQSCSAALNF
jgi:hypothetical protein